MGVVPHIDPIAVTIPAACAFTGLSRSALYRVLAAGDLLAVKQGSRTLVMTDSLRRYLASLPPATFRPTKGAS